MSLFSAVSAGFSAVAPVVDMASNTFSLVGDITAPYALISTNRRQIGTIIPDVVIEENAEDELLITEHPVEIGAAMSDHAYKRPAMIEMRCGCSDSNGGLGYSRFVYEQFLQLQAQREPFDVYSGKRAYTNMLIRSISLRNDRTTENALEVVVVLQYVIITDTQQGGTTPQANQSDPQQTSDSFNSGTQQLATMPNGAPTFAQTSAINYQSPATGGTTFQPTLSGF